MNTTASNARSRSASSPGATGSWPWTGAATAARAFLVAPLQVFQRLNGLVNPGDGFLFLIFQRHLQAFRIDRDVGQVGLGHQQRSCLFVERLDEIGHFVERVDQSGAGLFGLTGFQELLCFAVLLVARLFHDFLFVRGGALRRGREFKGVEVVGGSHRHLDLFVVVQKAIRRGAEDIGLCRVEDQDLELPFGIAFELL